MNDIRSASPSYDQWVRVPKSLCLTCGFPLRLERVLEQRLNTVKKEKGGSKNIKEIIHKCSTLERTTAAEFDKSSEGSVCANLITLENEYLKNEYGVSVRDDITALEPQDPKTTCLNSEKDVDAPIYFHESDLDVLRGHQSRSPLDPYSKHQIDYWLKLKDIVQNDWLHEWLLESFWICEFVLGGGALSESVFPNRKKENLCRLCNLDWIVNPNCTDNVNQRNRNDYLGKHNLGKPPLSYMSLKSMSRPLLFTCMSQMKAVEGRGITATVPSMACIIDSSRRRKRSPKNMEIHSKGKKSLRISDVHLEASQDNNPELDSESGPIPRPSNKYNVWDDGLRIPVDDQSHLSTFLKSGLRKSSSHQTAEAGFGSLLLPLHYAFGDFAEIFINPDAIKVELVDPENGDLSGCRTTECTLYNKYRLSIYPLLDVDELQNILMQNYDENDLLDLLEQSESPLVNINKADTERQNKIMRHDVNKVEVGILNNESKIDTNFISDIMAPYAADEDGVDWWHPPLACQFPHCVGALSPISPIDGLQPNIHPTPFKKLNLCRYCPLHSCFAYINSDIVNGEYVPLQSSDSSCHGLVRREPLGLPPICSCVDVEFHELWEAMVKKGFNEEESDEDLTNTPYGICSSCSGLTYFPFSIIEVPICNGLVTVEDFSKSVPLGATDIYSEVPRMTILIVCKNDKHERMCMLGLEIAGMKEIATVFDICSQHYFPFYAPNLERYFNRMHGMCQSTLKSAKTFPEYSINIQSNDDINSLDNQRDTTSNMSARDRLHSNSLNSNNSEILKSNNSQILPLNRVATPNKNSNDFAEIEKKILQVTKMSINENLLHRRIPEKWEPLVPPRRTSEKLRRPFCIRRRLAGISTLKLEGDVKKEELLQWFHLKRSLWSSV